jgi:tetratricopeptide (TPR) repeat protein
MVLNIYKKGFFIMGKRKRSKKRKTKIASKIVRKKEKKYIKFKNAISKLDFKGAISFILEEKSIYFSYFDNLDTLIPIVDPWMPDEINLKKYLDFLEFILSSNQRFLKIIAFNLAYGLVQKYPDDPDVNSKIAYICIILNLHDLSETYSEKALELDPQNIYNHLNSGEVLRQQNDLDGAKYHFNEAIILDSESSAAHERIAEVYKFQNEFEKYEYHINESIKYDPDNIYALYSKAQYEITVKENEKEFLELLKEMEEKYPKSPYVDSLKWIYRSIKGKPDDKFSDSFITKCKQQGIYPRLGALVKSKEIDKFEKLLDDNGFKEMEAEFSYFNHKGWTHFIKGELEEAKTNFEKSLEHNPDYIESNLNYISTLIYLKEYKIAKQKCFHVLKLSPYSISARKHLSNILIIENKYIEAREYIKEIFEFEEDSYEGNFLMAISFFKEDNLEEAEKYIKKTINNDTNGFHYYLYGEILFLLKRYSESLNKFDYFLNDLKTLKNIFPEIISNVYFYKAHIFYKIEKIKNTIKYFKKAIKLDENKANYNDISIAYIKKQRWFKAKKFIGKALKIDQFYEIALKNKKQLNEILKKFNIYVSILTILVFGNIFFLLFNSDSNLNIFLSILTLILMVTKRLFIKFKIPIFLEVSTELDFTFHEKYTSWFFSIREKEERVSKKQ